MAMWHVEKKVNIDDIVDLVKWQSNCSAAWSTPLELRKLPATMLSPYLAANMSLSMMRAMARSSVQPC